MGQSLDIPDILDIANISEYLCVCDIERGGLYGGGQDLQLPTKIYMVKKNVQWMYDIDPSDSTLRFTANYLYALCNKYVLKAQHTTGGGGSVSPVSPSFGNMIEYLIEVYGGVPDFTNATDYDDTRIVGHNLVIFWNDIPKFLVGGIEWAYTPTGIRILYSGFDAVNNNYDFKIFIKDPLSATGSTGVEVTRAFQYTGITGSETSITSSIIEDSTIVSVSRGTPYEMIFSGTPTGLQVLIDTSTGNICNGTIEFDSSNPISVGEVVEIIFSKAI